MIDNFYVVRIERIRVGEPFATATEAAEAASRMAENGGSYAIVHGSVAVDRIEEGTTS